MKKVAILGSGVVGITLAKGFEKHGYPVVMGTQHPEKKVDWNGQVTTFADAAQQAEILLLAVKGGVAEDVVKTVATHASGKTVIDATNPIADAPPQKGVLKFFTTMDNSLMERLQRLAPQANFVKALNSVGNGLMINPEFKGGPPTMLFRKCFIQM